MHIVNHPGVPYWGHIPEGVHPGTVIQIDGHIPNHCHKFEVNLYTGSEVGHHAEKHSNIALQVRPKIHTKKVIVNSRQFGHWGHKEKIRNFHHIHHGSAFNLQIIAEHQHYRVMFNGQSVCTFHHRIPFQEVRVLNIEGHPEVHRIEYKHAYSSQPSAPMYPSAPPAYIAPTVSYPHSTYTQPTVYPAPPVYIGQPAYVPQTIVVEDHHHHGGHHGGHGIGHHIADAIFGHDHHHGGHHYDSHHHGGHHGGHHGHHGHHW